MQKQPDSKPENEGIDSTEPDSSEFFQMKEPGSVVLGDTHDKKARMFTVYVLICAFVAAVLACEVYAFLKSNDKLINDILSLLERVILLVLGYYFAKKE